MSLLWKMFYGKQLLVNANMYQYMRLRALLAISWTSFALESNIMNQCVS